MPIYALLAVLFVLSSAGGAAAASSRPYPVKGLALEMGTAYRVDQFNWNISGTPSGGSGPVNVLSELTWTDLEIVELSVLGRKTANKIYLRGSLNLGFIYSGANRDSDYRGENRTIEYSRSENDSSAGTVWDISLGGGYNGWVLTAGEGAFTFRPLIGLSVHKQNLAMTDGFQVIPASGPFYGLNSSYNALWAGPWAGFDADYAFGALTLFGTLEMHGAVYRAEADWNLRSDFQHPVSFEHTANSIGLVFALGADYSITDTLTVSASFKRQDWHTFPGTDRTFFSSGLSSDTRLNAVNWISDAFTIGLNLTY